MSANEIPAADWRVIAAGVRDPDELARLRFAYTAGCYRGKWLALDAIGQLTMPDTAPIAVLVDDWMRPEPYVPDEDALKRAQQAFSQPQAPETNGERASSSGKEPTWSEYFRKWPNDR